MDSINVNNRIREIRKLRGLSQAKLAKMIGKDRTQVTRYESKAKLQADILYKIADALNVRVDELFKV